MEIPKECKMPDLSNLDSSLINRLVITLLAGEQDISPNASKYRRNFIRLIDRAISHYLEARNDLINLIEEAPKKGLNESGYLYFALVSFPDHMETVINSLSRLYKLLEAIMSEENSPRVPRTLRRSVMSQDSAVRDIRNCIEHIDGDIQKGKIVSGKPVLLSIDLILISV